MISKEERPYPSVLLDDPSMMAPAYASLLADENGKGHNLAGRGAAGKPTERR